MHQHAAEMAEFRARVKELISEASQMPPEVFGLKFSHLMGKGLTRSYQLGQEAVLKRKGGAGGRRMAASVLAGQLRHMYRFAQDIRNKQGRMNYRQRADMYGAQLDAAFLRGMVEAMEGDDVVHWKLHPAEHCPDCIQLARRSPYTVSSLPTVPGEGQTECLSNCRCTLEFHPKAASRREYPTPAGPGTRTSAGFTHGRVNRGLNTTEMQTNGITGSWYERIHAQIAASAVGAAAGRRRREKVKKAITETYPQHSMLQELWTDFPGSDIEEYYRQASGKMYGGTYPEGPVGRALTAKDEEAVEELHSHGLPPEGYILIETEGYQFLVPEGHSGRQWVSKNGGPFEPAGTVESYLHDSHTVNVSEHGLEQLRLFRPVERGQVKAGDMVEMSSLSSFTDDQKVARMPGKDVMSVLVSTTRSMFSQKTGLNSREHVLIGGKVRVAGVEKEES